MSTTKTPNQHFNEFLPSVIRKENETIDPKIGKEEIKL